MTAHGFETMGGFCCVPDEMNSIGIIEIYGKNERTGEKYKLIVQIGKITKEKWLMSDYSKG